MAAQITNHRPKGDVIQLGWIWYLSRLTSHSAGCVWNDICDRDVDRLVGAPRPILSLLTQIDQKCHLIFLERSKDRPLAAGTVSVRHAFYLLAGLYAITIGLFSLTNPVSYVIIIPMPFSTLLMESRVDFA